MSVAIDPPQKIRPQKGPQEAFLSTPADIAIYGGSAGGGKTWALLLEPLRHVENNRFSAVFFRRNTTQIKNQGGLWDESQVLYQPVGAEPRHTLDWIFPSGAKIAFRHLEYENTKFDWQGSQIPLICFDELTHFTESQFFYLLSRNRSMCGVRPYIRATCNPDADSWVAKFIEWWIDQKTGLPIPERSGVIRYFIRVGDEIKWADEPEELSEYKMINEDLEEVPIPPKSFTFIPAKLTDNKALMKTDPGYMANLLALGSVERERLLAGNWKIRPAAGLLFQRHWVEMIAAAPAGTRWVRGWDLAATPKTPQTPDPDATASTLIGMAPDGTIIIGHHIKDWLSPSGVRRLMKNMASQDGTACMIAAPQDPGQAGKSQKQDIAAALVGYDVRFSPETGDKITRFSPFSAQAEAGNVKVVRGEWNSEFFDDLEAFPEGKHDDAPDSVSRGFNELANPRRWYEETEVSEAWA